MSIWPILVVAVISGIFALRQERLRRMLDGARRKVDASDNKRNLQHSLTALIDFLSKHEEFKWADFLRTVRDDLQNQHETQALSRLSDCFGGMGSLNDVVFDDAEAEREGGGLMDAVFRDMKLYHGGPQDRVQWMKLEEEHKGELPPRIKHAFRKE